MNLVSLVVPLGLAVNLVCVRGIVMGWPVLIIVVMSLLVDRTARVIVSRKGFALVMMTCRFGRMLSFPIRVRVVLLVTILGRA